MAERKPSYAGFEQSSGAKSGLTEKKRDKVTQQNQPKSAPSPKGYA